MKRFYVNSVIKTCVAQQEAFQSGFFQAFDGGVCMFAALSVHSVLGYTVTLN